MLLRKRRLQVAHVLVERHEHLREGARHVADFIAALCRKAPHEGGKAFAPGIVEPIGFEPLGGCGDPAERIEDSRHERNAENRDHAEEKERDPHELERVTRGGLGNGRNRHGRADRPVERGKAPLQGQIRSAPERHGARSDGVPFIERQPLRRGRPGHGEGTAPDDVAPLPVHDGERRVLRKIERSHPVGEALGIELSLRRRRDFEIVDVLHDDGDHAVDLSKDREIGLFFPPFVPYAEKAAEIPLEVAVRIGDDRSKGDAEPVGAVSAVERLDRGRSSHESAVGTKDRRMGVPLLEHVREDVVLLLQDARAPPGLDRVKFRTDVVHFDRDLLRDETLLAQNRKTQVLFEHSRETHEPFAGGFDRMVVDVPITHPDQREARHRHDRADRNHQLHA